MQALVDVDLRLLAMYAEDQVMILAVHRLNLAEDYITGHYALSVDIFSLADLA